MTDEREEKARLAAEAQLLEQQLLALRGELERIAAALIEIEKAREGIQGMKKGDEVLVPLGAGVLGKMKVEDDKTIVPVGGGYAIRTSKERALSILEKARKATKERHDKLLEYVKGAEEKLLELLRKVGY